MKKGSSIALLLVLVGCSTMQPPRYAVSVDNIEALRSYEDASLNASSFTMSTSFSAACRLMGPIEPADGLSIPAFIEKAFNDELKMAGIHSSDGTTISGDVTHVSFNSMAGANWDISINLTSSNGANMTASNKYEFRSGFDAVTACNATADALSPAVQDLIHAIVTSPEFKALL